MFTKHVHRSIFPNTDHGYTWIEQMWFENDTRRCSAVVCVGGCTERLGHMPGGPIRCDLEWEESHACKGGKADKTEYTEEIHDGFHKVNSVSIVPV